MSTAWNRFGVVVLCLAIALGALALGNRLTPAQAQGEKAAGAGPHFTVVETEGHNLLVTDNGTNTLYFYTIDKDAKIGSEMKLRGQLDLKQVGKPTIKPENVKPRD